ncbi:hypothetical protein M406DRAFT_85351 [Cryphonectria parasitica EP155]|uniref:Carrier domain-containing protein n=1 Tax=Cryphonectria parasitica (strain ATCC 38755 / EP155) TaxID=660469 RepID=A0A9P4XZU5_CRYP1|nr:uncharacterized protein M406DRAFT_85351 [Cryphonectria parasitica EP155]KAF3763946.1 hypothetical protein M406DRAFT_85351 [Cryphonectria parasitica EP155]
MRLPGGVQTAESLWDLLDNRREGRCKVPDTRYNVEAFYGPGRAGHVGSEYGHFLQDVDLAEVDTSFWSMTRQEIEEMDPQQRLALEVVYECFQSSGTTKWRGKNIGAYFGIFGEDWAELAAKETQQTGVYRLLGTGDYVVANRVSYEFNLRGPSVIIRTACSSSLTGLHEACMGIQRGECESAIVGGTNLIMSPSMTIGMSEQGVIAPDGRSKSFDAKANGYARAEGVVAIHVKKLSDAIRDNDPIRAVIRSSCLNSDGKTAGLTQPSSDAHHRLILRSHQLAGVDITKTAMVECHGTGTPIGDPLETGAVARAFGTTGVYIGSLKPNIGHSEGASGLSSTLKAMLALERRLIPPNINFTEGNPRIPFKENKLTVPLKTTPWPAGKAERIGINSFGIGGANAHMLLESAAQNGVQRSSTPTPITNSHYLLTFSASHPDSLRRTVQSHQKYLQDHPDRLADLSYTLNQRREALQQRAYSVVDANELDQPFHVSSFGRAGAGNPQVAFVFTGQGAQWPQMGADLLQTNTVFRESIAAMDDSLSRCAQPPLWTLREELLKAGKTSRIMGTEFSQPCCTAVQVALVDVLSSWGISPSSVVGHSSGEIAAAYAAGALSKESAILTAYYRGIVTEEVTTTGGMAAVGLGRTTVEPFLKPGVVIACENSPSSVTLSGDSGVLDEVVSIVRQEFPDAAVRALRVDCAYHSHHMRPAAERYLELMPDLGAIKPQIPWFSSVRGNEFEGKPDASYWGNNLVQPVLFSPAVAAMLKYLSSSSTSSSSVLLEVGPHSALAGPVRQILQAAGTSKVEYANTLTRGQPGEQSLLTSAGRLWQLGVDLDLDPNKTERETATSSSSSPPGRPLTDLPLYPWRREGPFWSESRLSKFWRFRKFPKHDLLGERVAAASDSCPTWRNLLRLSEVPYLRDHKVSGDVVFPAAGFMAIAGEAVRQLGDSEDWSYSLREVHISTALVLQEGFAGELITHLRPVKLTNSLDSVWYEFDISAVHGDRWTKHAMGQVRQGSEVSPPPAKNIVARQRTVDPPYWYKVMDKFGLEYGPNFQGLREMTADVLRHEAVATISGPEIPQHTSAYAVHPTTLDFVLQMYSVASSMGQARRFRQLAVPSYIGSAYIRPAASETSDIRLEVAAELTPRGAIVGDAVGICGESTVLSFQNLRMSPLADAADARGEDPHAAGQMIWKPCVRLLDNASALLHTAKKDQGLPSDVAAQVDHMALACAIEASISLSGKYVEGGNAASSASPHLAKYRAWLDDVKAQAENNSKEIVDLSSSDRLALIEKIFGEISSFGESARVQATAVHRVFTALHTIFNESSDQETQLEVDFQARIYEELDSVDATEFYKLLAHYKPNLRILEIGAGTGGTAKTILDTLSSIQPHHGRHYDSYTFTDVTSDLFDQVKERLAGKEAVTYKAFDVSQDPVQQGFEEEGFDLIIASQAIHATSDPSASLRHVRRLLSPTGHLFLQELAPSTSKWLNFVMGAFPSWWAGERGRQTASQWESLLQSTGFDHIAASHHDNQHLSTSIIARPATPAVPKRITILTPEAGDKQSTHIQEVTTLLKNKGYSIDTCNWGQQVPANQDVLALMDFDTPFLQDMQSPKYTQVQSFVRSLSGTGVLWVTGPAQINCTNPSYGLMIGLARTMRTEQTLDFGTLELESFDPAGWNAIAAVLPEFQSRLAPDADTNPVMEWALADGRVQISRFHWVSLSEELAVSQEGESARKLDVEKRGFLNTLYWKEYAPAKPEGNHLRVRNRSCGLNFKDVLIAMGIVDGVINEGYGLGLEAAGIVEEVGPDVQNLKAGDRCIAIPSGAMSTHLTTTEHLCVKIPDELSFEEAATMATVYCTAIYSLVDRARVEAGQTVLIHSAAGGVGIAAIQICRWLGAEIYCTVGSEDKVRWLTETFNIPRERIFHSRDLTFRRDILKATQGRGVDAVLNSLSGELLHASWDCVAEYGTMLEIGKRDLIGKGALALEHFEQNRSYVGIDLGRLCAQRPLTMQRLLRQIVDLYKSGDIKPISPMTCFEATRVEEAMRFMQKGSHLGKVVINMPETADELKSRAPKRGLVLDPSASYVLAGGLGGLGQAVAVWMAESGATEIVFLSRSAGDQDRYAGFIEELRSLGCKAILVAGNVTNLSDVERAVQSATKPVRGAMQATMVLQDDNFLDMTFEKWSTCLSTKVQGTWNLHNALLGHELDFFLLFSSWSGIVGYTGQANYAAANAFLDSFVQYRHAQGLTAVVVDMAGVEDIGYVSRTSSVMEHFRATSTFVSQEADVLDSLQVMINRSKPSLLQPWSSENASSPGKYQFMTPAQICIGLRTTQPLLAPTNRVVWKRDPRMGLYKNMDVEGGQLATGGGNEALKQFLTEVSQNRSRLDSDEAPRFLATEFGKAVFGFLMRDLELLDLDESLEALGVDSLVSIELRNWFRQRVGLEFTTLEILGSQSLLALGKLAVQRLKIKLSVTDDPSNRATAEDNSRYLVSKAP